MELRIFSTHWKFNAVWLSIVTGGLAGLSFVAQTWYLIGWAVAECLYTYYVARKDIIYLSPCI